MIPLARSEDIRTLQEAELLSPRVNNNKNQIRNSARPEPRVMTFSERCIRVEKQTRSNSGRSRDLRVTKDMIPVKLLSKCGLKDLDRALSTSGQGAPVKVPDLCARYDAIMCQA
jgi:hypothetical protein